MKDEIELLANYQKIKDLIQLLNDFNNDGVRFKQPSDGEFVEDVDLNYIKDRREIRFEVRYETSDNKHLILRKTFYIDSSNNSNVDLDKWFDIIYRELMKIILFLLPNRFQRGDGAIGYSIPISSLINKGYNESKRLLDERFE